MTLPGSGGRHGDLFAGVPADVLRTDQVAERLHLTPATVRSLAAEGRIPAQKLGQEWRYFWPAVVRAIFEGSINGDGGHGGSTRHTHSATAHA